MNDDRPEWADADEPIAQPEPVPAVLVIPAQDVPDADLEADAATTAYDPTIEGQDPA